MATQAETQNEIIQILKATQRPGIEKVIDYLNQSDYFTTSSSTHHKFKGGLAYHSLNVYKKMMKVRPKRIHPNSVAIVSLLHDICSTHFPEYKHIGRHRHGLRSLLLLQELGLRMSVEEELAIENHMFIYLGFKHKLWQRLYFVDKLDAFTYYPSRKKPYEK